MNRPIKEFEKLEANPFKANKNLIVDYIMRCFEERGCRLKFNKKRMVETLLAYKKSIHFLPKEAIEILEKLPPKLQKEIEKKEKELNKFIWKE